MNSEWFARWKAQHSLPDRIHRKDWEVAIVSEILDSNGCLTENRHGVGYGCGSESLATYIASRGPKVLATDLLQGEWSHIHGGFSALENERIQLRCVDMNWLKGESGKQSVEEGLYDFGWSVCSMDHCGSTWLTKRFLLNQMNCLKVGGLGVHTAEYTISSGLPRNGSTSWLDWNDMVDVQNLMTQMGHELAPIDWSIGDSVEDHQMDLYPYGGRVHLKPEVHAGRWGTCVVFAAKRVSPKQFWIPVEEDIAREQLAQRSHSQM